MTLFEITCAIREVEGHVWHIDFLSYGVIFRAQVGRYYIRAVVPKPNIGVYTITQESNSLLFVVKSAIDFKKALQKLRQP